MGIINGMRLVISGKVNDVTYKGVTILNEDNIALLDIFASAVDNLSNYYNKSEIDSMISVGFNAEIVEELPTDEISQNTIYFKPKEGSETDAYNEYMYINGKWENIGSTSIDLTDYATKDYVEDNFISKLQSIKTPNMQDRVGIDENGQLWYEKGGSSGQVSSLVYGGEIRDNGIIMSSLYPEIDGLNISDIDKNTYKNFIFKAINDVVISLGSGSNIDVIEEDERPITDYFPSIDYIMLENELFNAVLYKSENFQINEDVNPQRLDLINEFYEFNKVTSQLTLIPWEYLEIQDGVNPQIYKFKLIGLDHENKTFNIELSTLKKVSIDKNTSSGLMFSKDDHVLISDSAESQYIKIVSQNTILTKIVDDEGNDFYGEITAQLLRDILDIKPSSNNITIEISEGF